MAFTQQPTPKVQTQRVLVDFPNLPTVPDMTIAADRSAMRAYQIALDTWYQSLKSTLIDKLTAMQTQIDTINAKA